MRTAAVAAWSSISSRVSAFCVGSGGIDGALPDDACASTCKDCINILGTKISDAGINNMIEC